MNKNKNTAYKGSNKGKGKYNHNKDRNAKGSREQRNEERYDGTKEMLSAKGRDNNPNWYFLDAKVAEQVSQLSFQELAGTPFALHTIPVLIPNIARINLNPSPGVQLGVDYTIPGAAQNSAINVAGFRLYSKLSAFTGRTQSYGPQDISTMILFMGEIISMVEYIRRVFGVSYLLSERNRSFPAKLIRMMGVDPDDFFRNRSTYRDRFNYLITRINQVPIPQNVAYFDKCASLYEHIYMDSSSPMGTIIFCAPATTWELDETSYAGGTVLKTHQFTYQADGTELADYANPLLMSAFLANLSNRVDELMNSSTFNVVYTDLLNLATKMQVPFWKFDYLDDSYAVAPEYNPNFLLQFHNMTSVDQPTEVTTLTTSGTDVITPLNDVYPNASGNALYYNPAFIITRADISCIVDSLVPDPSTEDRIEMTRFMALGNTDWTDTNGVHHWIDCALPDHYVTIINVLRTDDQVSKFPLCNPATDAVMCRMAALMSRIDWAPFIYRVDPVNGGLDSSGSNVIGDTNFYTEMDRIKLRRLHDFVGLGLYDMR